MFWFLRVVFVPVCLVCLCGVHCFVCVLLLFTSHGFFFLFVVWCVCVHMCFVFFMGVCARVIVCLWFVSVFYVRLLICGVLFLNYVPVCFSLWRL